jgi:hypothetical protein
LVFFQNYEIIIGKNLIVFEEILASLLMVLPTGFPPIGVDPVSISLKPLLSTSSAWFVIQVLFALNSSTLETIKDKCGMSFRSEDMVRTGIFQKYLSSNQVSCLQKNAQVKVFQPNGEWKTRISNQQEVSSDSVPRYLVRASPTGPIQT